MKSQLASTSKGQIKRSEAIIQSMTRDERRHPEKLNASRRKRIAEGSGTSVRDVNELLKSFNQAKKMAKQMKKAQKKLLKFRG